MPHKIELLRPVQDNYPEAIERVVIEDRISKGGLADVYRAHSPIDGAILAVKVARCHELARACLAKEASLTPAINSPYIYPILRAGRISSRSGHLLDGRDCIVSPYNWGGTLADHPTSSPASAHSNLRVLEHAARGLKDEHNHGYVHGDVKPDNIFVVDEDNGYLTDLGLSVRIGQPMNVGLPELGDKIVFGTLRYMSPNQAAAGEMVESDDVFSLGATAVESLTGGYPWPLMERQTDGTQTQPYSIAQTRKTFRPHVVWPDYLPDGLRELESALSPQPEAAPTMDEMIAILSGARQQIADRLLESTEYQLQAA